MAFDGWFIAHGMGQCSGRASDQMGALTPDGGTLVTVDSARVFFLSLIHATLCVPVAQWTERLPSKQLAAGSNPAWDATSSPI